MNEIKQIMTSNLVTIVESESISNVIEIMNNNDFDHLPVLDNSGNLTGIISKTDLYQKALHLSKNTTGETYSKKILYTTTAKDIMTKNPISVSSSQSVDFVIELLLQGDFHALPVLENEKLIGIITSKDILEYMIDHKYKLT